MRNNYSIYINLFIIASISFITSGCANNEKKADEAAARYAELEGDLLRSNEEQEIRRRNEMRVAEKLRQLGAGTVDTNRQSVNGADSSRLVTPIIIEDNTKKTELTTDTQAEFEGATAQSPEASSVTEANKLTQFSSRNTNASREKSEFSANTISESDDTQTISVNADASKANAAAVTPPETSAIKATDDSTTDESSAGKQIWTYMQHPNPITGRSTCAVVSDSTIIRNGTLDTIVTVIIMSDAIYLRTDATFDIDSSDTGYRVDAGFPVSFNSYANELTAVVDQDYKRLYEMITSGSILTATFAYMPQLSDTETHRLELNLDSIKEPLDELAACRSKASVAGNG